MDAHQPSPETSDETLDPETGELAGAPAGMDQDDLDQLEHARAASQDSEELSEDRQANIEEKIAVLDAAEAAAKNTSTEPAEPADNDPEPGLEEEADRTQGGGSATEGPGTDPRDRSAEGQAEQIRRRAKERAERIAAREKTTRPGGPPSGPGLFGRSTNNTAAASPSAQAFQDHRVGAHAQKPTPPPWLGTRWRHIRPESPWVSFLSGSLSSERWLG